MKGIGSGLRFSEEMGFAFGVEVIIGEGKEGGRKDYKY